MEGEICNAFYKRFKRMEKAIIEQNERDGESDDGFTSRCSSDFNFIKRFNDPVAFEIQEKQRVAKTPFINFVSPGF